MSRSFYQPRLTAASFALGDRVGAKHSAECFAPTTARSPDTRRAAFDATGHIAVLSPAEALDASATACRKVHPDVGAGPRTRPVCPALGCSSILLIAVGTSYHKGKPSLSVNRGTRPDVADQSSDTDAMGVRTVAPAGSAAGRGWRHGVAALTLAAMLLSGCAGNQDVGSATGAAASTPTAVSAPPRATAGVNESDVSESAEASAPESAAGSTLARDPKLYEGREDRYPEVLRTLTEEQLIRKLQISEREASTPEAFAKEYPKRLEMALNLGSTETEAGEYAQNFTDGYQEKMEDKYGRAIAEGLLGEHADTTESRYRYDKFIKEAYLAVRDRYLGTLTNDYHDQLVSVEYDGHEVVNEWSNGSYEVKIRLIIKDTYSKVDPTLQSYNITDTITVLVTDKDGDGVLETSIQDASALDKLSHQQ